MLDRSNPSIRSIIPIINSININLELIINFINNIILDIDNPKIIILDILLYFFKHKLTNKIVIINDINKPNPKLKYRLILLII